MSRKSPFAPESATKPGRARHEAPTVPPPGRRKGVEPEDESQDEPRPSEAKTTRAQKTSTVRPKQRASIPAATVDEVTADLKKDPRAED